MEAGWKGVGSGGSLSVKPLQNLLVSWHSSATITEHHRLGNL